MNYGYFDNAAREYVITIPETPYPWINYLGNSSYYTLFSNTAGGYSFYRDARLRRITRYRYNNIPIDNEGRYFYIRDTTDGTLWSPAYRPSMTPLDAYSCSHGLGYTRITAKKCGIESEHTALVPLDLDGEIHRLRITNTTSNPRTLQIYSYIEWCLWDAQDDMTNFQRNLSIGEVAIHESTVLHLTEYRERRNHYAYFTVNHPISGYDTDREKFIGLYGTVQAPKQVIAGTSANSKADGWAPIASHRIDISLAPGESRTFIFQIGYVENTSDTKFTGEGEIRRDREIQMVSRFQTSEQVDTALAELAGFWDTILGKLQVSTPDPRFDTMVNIWNAYQCMTTFNLSRSASYFESGVGRGMGFRDSNQDILGFVHQIPTRARERLIDLASTLLADGSAYHQYQPLSKIGNADIGGDFNDDPLWLVLAISAYVRETGDWSILEEDIPYRSDPGDRGSMLEHVIRAFKYAAERTGPHGLPLIGRADWNDCLNLNCFSDEPGQSFQTVRNKGDGLTAESIFIAGLAILAAKDLIPILQRVGFHQEAARVQKTREQLESVTMEQGYDGQWFLRAYDAFGDRVGSHTCDDGKIFIEPQGICVMAGLGVEDGRAECALDAAKTWLDSDFGMVLVQPAYKTYHLELGEISSYPPGYKENAGIFCHNNPWICIAETVIGRGDRAFEVYRKISPAYLQEISELHRTEPYVYSQVIAGKDARRHGEAKNSWLTGTAAWNYVAATQHIIGIRPDFDGLIVAPCIPSDWEEFSVVREYRGVRYRITVKNPDHVCSGVRELFIDGKGIDLKIPIIPYDSERTDEEVQVLVILG